MTMPLDPIKAEAYRRLLSSLFRGRKFSEEHKKSLSEAAKKRDPEAYKGKREYMKEWREKNKEMIKEKYVKQRKVRRQKDLEILAGRPKPENCEVCGGKQRICFDHCHETGKFRGWICEHCNVLLGFAKDNPKILRLLVDYLEKNS